MQQLRGVSFTVPFALPSLNTSLRTHWAKRGRERDALIKEIIAAVGGPAHYPRPPFARCRLTVVRHGKRLLDADNLAASVKHLADALCLPTRRHPGSLGFIVDDSAGTCEIVATQVKAGGKPMKLMTVVTLEELK